MATLTREAPAQVEQPAPNVSLISGVPSPFPAQEMDRLMKQQQHSSSLGSSREQQASLTAGMAAEGPSARGDTTEATSRQETDTSNTSEQEIMPSVASVERSCIMILSDLLSSAHSWLDVAHESAASHPPTALEMLLFRLRQRQSEEGSMAEIPRLKSETELITELRSRVDSLSSTLPHDDAELAQTVVSLLVQLDRLHSVSSTVSTPGVSQARKSWAAPESGYVDPFDTLERHVSDLRQERSNTSSKSGTERSPVHTVQSALLWSNIDRDLETVLSLCRRRQTTLEYPPSIYNLPPDYTYSSNEPGSELPPEYEGSLRYSTGDSDSKVRNPLSSISNLSDVDEKMKIDLDSVTSAIDRLYAVCPQLHNQRVELRAPKRMQLEQARMSTAPSSSSMAMAASSSRESSGLKGAGASSKAEEPDVKELQRMIEMINRASGRRLDDQSVVLEGGMQAKLEKARQRDIKRRQEFVEHLAEHSDAGRLHDQDATPQGSRLKDPDALLSLPEFIREAMPPDMQQHLDPEAMLTLPEFVREMPEPPVPAESLPPPPLLGRTKSLSRSRSLSAPPLSWLLPGGSRPTSPKTEGKHSRNKSRSKRPGSSGKTSSTSFAGLEVAYVAEHHENLQHVLVFCQVSSMTPGVNLEAEVLPAAGSEGERLILRCGPSTSPPLSLPVRVVPGKKDVLVQNSHFEVKLATYGSSSANGHTVDGHALDQRGGTNENERPALLDATQLTTTKPTSFICASCSLPLVAAAKVGRYRDLPSEYWAELVEAWMCHADQKLNEHVVRHSAGFWPEPEEVLVGGSYLLLREEAVVKSNLSPPEQRKHNEEWSLARCLCGSVAGRCQEHTWGDGTPSVVYRLAKFAIRPVSPKADLSRIPLSAFVVEDMIELVQAHATYRFVVFDEEDDKPRLLIWLFKPSIRLTYTTPAQYILPRSGSQHAAKALWKILGPASQGQADLASILDKYPGFPQAEHLFYPMNVCRRLAAMLKESSTAYPDSVRTMCGLEVGWLSRA